MSPQGIVVMGTGGHASVVIDLARCAGLDVLGCFGPQPPDFSTSYCRYLGNDSVLDTLDRHNIAVAIGAGSIALPALRRRLFEAVLERGFIMPALTHPRAVVAGSANIASAVQILAGAVIQPFATLGHNVLINTAAVIEHHARIEDHVHVSSGAVVCGTVTVGAASHIGANATVRQSLAIGAGTIIGAGAVVVANVAANQVLKGNPAR